MCMALNLGGLLSDLGRKDPGNSTEAVCKLFTSFNEWVQALKEINKQKRTFA